MIIYIMIQNNRELITLVFIFPMPKDKYMPTKIGDNVLVLSGKTRRIVLSNHVNNKSESKYVYICWN